MAAFTQWHFWQNDIFDDQGFLYTRTFWSAKSQADLDAKVYRAGGFSVQTKTLLTSRQKDVLLERLRDQW